MTPIRMFAHIRLMTSDPDETPATIKSMANTYRTTANAAKDYDVEWYAKNLIAVIDQLVAAGWPPVEILRQLAGRLSGIVPDVN